MPIINLNNNRQIIVNENNFPNVMTWKEALSICENNEENWRLPTIVELIEIYKQKTKDHLDYIKQNGVDPLEIENWKWTKNI